MSVNEMGFSMICQYCGKEPPAGAMPILNDAGCFCSQAHLDAYKRQKQEKARQAREQQAAAAQRQAQQQEASRLAAKKQRLKNMLINIGFTLLFAALLIVFILKPGFYSRMIAPLSRFNFTKTVVRQLASQPFIGTGILLFVCGFVFRVLNGFFRKKLPLIFACLALFILLGDLAAPQVTSRIRSLIPSTSSERSVSGKSQTWRFVDSDGLNIRSGPSSGTELVGTLHKNDRVEVLDSSGQWWKIRAGNLEGFVNSEYLRQ
jgi:hypothetical protein